MFLKGGRGWSAGNARQVGTLRKKGTVSRRKDSLGAPSLLFFGGGERKSEKGRKKEETSSHVRWIETWEVQELKRARATLLSEKGGSAEGTAGLIGESRRSAGTKPDGLVQKRRGGRSEGNSGSATRPEQSPEEQSP
jgi:hypothetical protein